MIEISLFVIFVCLALIATLPFIPARLLHKLSDNRNPFCKALGLYGYRRAQRHWVVIALAAKLLRAKFHGH